MAKAQAMKTDTLGFNINKWEEFEFGTQVDRKRNYRDGSEYRRGQLHAIRG